MARNWATVPFGLADQKNLTGGGKLLPDPTDHADKVEDLMNIFKNG